MKLALTNLRDELSNFQFYLEKLLTTLHFFLPEKYKETLDKTKQIFLMDLQNQFKKLISKNGKYSEEGVFFGNLWQERSFFISNEVLFSDNFFYCKKIFNKNFFSMKKIILDFNGNIQNQHIIKRIRKISKRRLD